jgi:hypothetical protein
MPKAGEFWCGGAVSRIGEPACFNDKGDFTGITLMFIVRNS